MFGRLTLIAAVLCASATSGLAFQTKEAAAAKPAALAAGMPAPAISVEKWVKGSPVANFEKGKVYVVEFWATWCGPCIASMPHLSALQADYKDKGVTFIGTNIWEDAHGKKYDETTLPMVEKFVAGQADRMAYTVAYDGPTKAMDANFMKAAGRQGIPSAFIVDQQGQIAWMGHPGSMDYALSEVVAGKWDVKTGPEREKQVTDQLKAIGSKLKSDPAGAQADWAKFETDYPAVAKHQDEFRLAVLKASGQWDKAYAIIGKQVDEAIARKDVMTLNTIAWGIVDPEADVSKRDLDLALRAATKAVEFTERKDAAVLDTLARTYFWKGDTAKAIDIETAAVSIAQADEKFDKNMRADIEKSLAEFKAKGAK